MTAPRAFVSHSHEDAAIARQLAEQLRLLGVDAWLDHWEILPGDSLIQKIFEEGLKNCQVFIIILSPSSVSSPWVKHELDAALVQRLSGATRVVPVVASPCDVPVSLRPLLRLDLSSDGVEGTVARLVDVAFGRDLRPALGPPPSGLNVTVPGLDNTSARMALLLASTMDQPDGRPVAYTGKDIVERLALTPEQVNDAVEQLRTLGLVRTEDWLGTSPFTFGQAEPTASLAFQLRGTGALDYDPEDDVKQVASAVVQLKSASGPRLHELTKLPPSRISRAVSYLEDYGLASVSKTLGTAPYDFRSVAASAATRRFLSQN